LACAAIGAIGFPGLAQGNAESSDPPATADVVAVDNAFRDASSADPSDNTVEITAGGSVTFGYPSGTSAHNVTFATAPSSCTQTAGIAITAAPPLPAYAQPQGWSGHCEFSTPGTYDFVCGIHPDMKGKVVVADAATPTPTPTLTATPTPTPTPTATPTETPAAAASVEAHDNWFSNKDVKIAPGETVHFDYPQGTSSHNVVFNAGTQPRCTQTAGVVITSGPPLPAFVQPKGWAGDCTFDAPGVYAFVCSAHNEMTGSVTVGTVAQATPVPTPGPPVRDGTPAPTPRAWASLRKPTTRQLRVLLRGRLKLTATCSTLDRGTVKLTVTKAVAKKLRLKSRTLATGKSRCNANGRFVVTLKPTKAAKKALKHTRRSVKVTARLAFPGLTTKQTITLTGAR
jgi:plastocyanin